WQFPLLPAAVGRVVAAQLVGFPPAPPDPATRVGPDPAGALVAGGRPRQWGATRPVVNAADMAAGQGGVEHLPVGGGGDAVGARAPRSIEHLDPANLRVEPSQHPRLPGGPQDGTAAS